MRGVCSVFVSLVRYSAAKTRKKRLRRLASVGWMSQARAGSPCGFRPPAGLVDNADVLVCSVLLSCGIFCACAHCIILRCRSHVSEALQKGCVDMPGTAKTSQDCQNFNLKAFLVGKVISKRIRAILTWRDLHHRCKFRRSLL